MHILPDNACGCKGQAPGSHIVGCIFNLLKIPAIGLVVLMPLSSCAKEHLLDTDYSEQMLGVACDVGETYSKTAFLFRPLEGMGVRLSISGNDWPGKLSHNGSTYRFDFVDEVAFSNCALILNTETNESHQHCSYEKQELMTVSDDWLSRDCNIQPISWPSSVECATSSSAEGVFRQSISYDYDADFSMVQYSGKSLKTNLRIDQDRLVSEFESVELGKYCKMVVNTVLQEGVLHCGVEPNFEISPRTALNLYKCE